MGSINETRFCWSGCQHNYSLGTLFASAGLRVAYVSHMSFFARRFLAVFITLMACSAHAAPATPLRIEKFFAGHTRSSGVFDNTFGKPQHFTTNCHGRMHGHTLWLDQRFQYDDGHTQDRHWQIRRIDDRHYLGRANDVVGEAHGEVAGSRFRFSYIVALKAGNPFFNVRLDQTMTLLRDGTVLNRATIRKLGLTLSRVTERFRRVSRGARS